MRKPVFVFLILCSAPAFLEADSTSLRPVEFKTIVIPFENQTGESSLDYLSLGVARLLSSKLEGTGFVRETRTRRTFLVGSENGRPGPEKEEPLRVLPVNVVLREEADWAKLAAVKESRFMCAKLKADAWVGGRITRSNDPSRDIVITVRLFRCDTGKSSEQTYTRGLNTIYRNMDEPAEFLQAALIAEKRFSISFESAEPGAMVFLGGVYVGRSPVTKPVIPGKYLVRAETQGRLPFEREIEVTADMKLTVDSPLRADRGALKVTSDPEGASVYLDMTYLGKTPLEKNGLPSGTHRVRVSAEGRVDRFVGVVLKDETPVEISVRLLEGDTAKVYQDPGYLILDWTRHDFSLYCALSSAVFYAGWAHFRIRADRVEDSVRTYIPSLLITDVPQRTVYELYLYHENQKAAKRERSKAATSGNVGIGLVFLSGYFLYSGFSYDDKEAGEVSSGPAFRFAVFPAGRGDLGWGAALQLRF